MKYGLILLVVLIGLSCSRLNVEMENSTEKIVAILDSGIDSQSCFSDRILGSTNFTKSSTSEDRNGHGTYVAGIVAKNSGAKLLNVKVVEDNGLVWSSSVARGIRWAVDHNADIINMSFIISFRSEELIEAVQHARNCQVLMFAASDNRASDMYPADCLGVISVAATKYGSSRADFCVSGSPSSMVEGKRSGSSMATAYVSSLALLIDKSLSEEEAIKKLEELDEKNESFVSWN